MARRQGTVAAALTGLVPATAASLGFGAPAIAPLALFVLGAGALTAAGRTAKAARGVGEGNEGTRRVRNVAAKLALPAVAGVSALLWPAQSGMLATGYVAGLAGAFADTAATETGPLAAGRPFLPRWGAWRRVAHGTPGAMSPLGAAAGIAAAAATAAVAVLPDLIGWRAAGIAAVSGWGASVLESLIAPTGLGRSLGHEGRNALLSVVAMIAAVLWVGRG